MRTLKSILLGTFVVAPIVVGGTFLFLNVDRKQQEIVRTSVRTIEYSVAQGDSICKLLRTYSNLPNSVDPRDVVEYTKELNGRKTVDLAVGEEILLPVYKSK